MQEKSKYLLQNVSREGIVHVTTDGGLKFIPSSFYFSNGGV